MGNEALCCAKGIDVSSRVKGLRVVVGIEVDADLCGVRKEDYVEGLRARLDRAVGNGLLTGDTPVEVDQWEVRIEQLGKQERALSEGRVEAWFRDLLESGSMSAEDVPRLMARYALSSAEAARAELVERMGLV